MCLICSNKRKMGKSIKTDILLQAGKEQVWQVLTDFERYHEWNPFIVRSSGKAVPGTVLEHVMKNGKKEIAFRPRVLKAEPYRYFDWMGHLFFKGIFDGHHYFELEEITPKQVKLTQGEHFSGLLSGVILNMIGEETRNNFIAMNRALGRRVEALEASASD